MILQQFSSFYKHQSVKNKFFEEPQVFESAY